MRMVKPIWRWLGTEPDGHQMIKNIAEAAHICYQAKPRENVKGFIDHCLKNGHLSPFEHEKLSVVVTCDRGVSHELVRHRIASYSQESTRYCNYSKGKFGEEVTFVEPWWWDRGTGEARELLRNALALYEGAYMHALDVFPDTTEAARALLPNCIKTQIVVTMNLREWRHFFQLRALGTTGKPHPDMQRLALMLLEAFKDIVPYVFDDLWEEAKKHEER